MDNKVTLDPDNAFEQTLISMVQVYRRKRADYALDGDAFSNFRNTSELLALPGFGPVEAAFFNCLQKIVRIKSLRANGRMHFTANESVHDTYLDLANYAVIALALANEEGAQ